MEHSKVLGQVLLPCTTQVLESCLPSQSSVLPASLGLVTPLNMQAWEWELRAHPNQALLSYILRGIRDGFRSGFHQSHSCKTAKRYKSAYQHPLPMEENLAQECEAGQVVGPYQFKHFHTQRLALLESSQNAISWEGGS